MSKGGRPPAAPDYIGAAREQGRQNLDAIRLGAALNRVNQVTPYGSVSYSRGVAQPAQPSSGLPSPGGKAPPAGDGGGKDPPGFVQHHGLFGDVAGAVQGQVAQQGQQPSTSGTTGFDPAQDQWTQTVSLSPNQQRIFDQSEGNQLDLGRIAGLRLGQVGNQGAFTLDGLPSRVSGVQGSNFERDVGAPSGEARSRAEDAVYRSATRQLDPQFQQREEQSRTRLINQGLREGSEAWNTEMGNLSRERDAAYGDARDRAIMAGGAEASRSLSDDLSRAGFANQTESQRFAQALQNAQLQNDSRAVGLDERILERDVPLREFMSLYGGGYNSPMEAPGIAQAGTPQPGDYQGAVGQQYGAQADLYNWNQQRNAQNMQSILQLAALFAG
jgi:hypothetical protein